MVGEIPVLGTGKTDYVTVQKMVPVTETGQALASLDIDNHSQVTYICG